MPNIFIVPSYKCNAKCKMCLFRSTELKECNMEDFKERVQLILNHGFCQQKNMKIKITGG